MQGTQMIREKTHKNTAFHNLLSCTTKQDKAFLLVLFSLVSFILAVVIEYFCYLSVGPTSLGTWYNPYWIGFFFVCGFLISAFFVFRHDIKTKPENLFLAIVLSFSLFSSISFNMNAPSWDSGSHYRFVVEWSKFGSPVALSVADIRIMELSSVDLYFNLSELKDYSNGLNYDSTILEESFAGKSIFFAYGSIGSHPATLVYCLVSLLPLSFTTRYIISRLIYAVIYSLVTFFGMKQLKSGKMLYAVIALLPAAVFFASNYGYDYWVNAFTLFAVACVVRELQTPDVRISRGRILLILGSFIVAFGPKAVYFPLVLLCLLIPRDKFSSLRASKLFRGGVIFACLFVAASFLVPFLYFGPGVGDVRGGSDVNAAEQVQFILSSPFEYARILLNNLPRYFSIFVAKDFIGFYAYLGYPSWPLWVIVFFLMLFTAVTDKTEIDNVVCTWKSRIYTLALNMVVLILILTALYVAFTGVRSEVMSGCHPRYFIPMLFCSLVFLSSHHLAWPKKNDQKRTLYNAAVLGLMSFVLMAGLWQVYVGLLY